MTSRSRLIPFFAGLLRVLLVLNIVCGVLFVVGIVATLVVDPARLGLRANSSVDIAATLNGIRAMLLLGLPAVAAAHVLLSALREITLTVRAGDPFQLANARRIRVIGWSLLALQLLDLVFGALDHWLAAQGVGAGGWTPSFTGWLATLAAFVLAEVWASGAAMRDELAGTV